MALAGGQSVEGVVSKLQPDPRLRGADDDKRAVVGTYKVCSVQEEG